MQDIINSIKCDLDHDKVMMQQIKDEMRELDMKLRYYQGKFDGRNEALTTITSGNRTI